MKIDKLTPEQESLMDVYRDKWLKIGLSTEPSNKPLAENALNRAYKSAGLTPPKQIIWTTSPLAGLLIVNILKDEKLVNKILKDLNSKKKMKLGSSVWGSVRSSVRSSVWGSVESSVWGSVTQNLQKIIQDAIYGQQDASWLSFYDYFREVCKLQDGKIHCTNGPAILYKDGFSVYAINGKILSGENLKKVQHQEGFNIEMDNILSEKKMS